MHMTHMRPLGHETAATANVKRARPKANDPHEIASVADRADQGRRRNGLGHGAAPRGEDSDDASFGANKGAGTASHGGTPAAALAFQRPDVELAALLAIMNPAGASGQSTAPPPAPPEGELSLDELLARMTGIG